MTARQVTPARLSRTVRARRPRAHRLSERDREILRALEDYPFLTAEQVARLVFGGLASLSYVRERLKLLWHAHLVERLFLHRSPAGSARAVCQHREIIPKSTERKFPT
jgi:hypothetical protein